MASRLPTAGHGLDMSCYCYQRDRGSHFPGYSLSDSLAQATPVSIPDTVVTNQVVALVTTDDSIALHLPGCTAIPGQLDPPPLPNADTANS